MLEAVFVVGALGFMEVVHVQLANEGAEVVMFEEPWQNGL